MKRRPFLNPEMTFKVLHSESSSATPPIDEHVSLSFFRVGFTHKQLVRFHRKSPFALKEKTEAVFMKKITPYAELLRCKSVQLPAEILFEIFPYLYGSKVWGIGHIVSAVGKIL